jgi:hypothetical protein
VLQKSIKDLIKLNKKKMIKISNKTDKVVYFQLNNSNPITVSSNEEKSFQLTKGGGQMLTIFYLAAFNNQVEETKKYLLQDCLIFNEGCFIVHQERGWLQFRFKLNSEFYSPPISSTQQFNTQAQILKYHIERMRECKVKSCTIHKQIDDRDLLIKLFFYMIGTTELLQCTINRFQIVEIIRKINY